MAQTAKNISTNGRAAALERRRAMISGGKVNSITATTATASISSKGTIIGRQPTTAVAQGGARLASRTRRQVLANQGKAAVKSNDRTRSDTIMADANVIESTPGLSMKNAPSKTECGCQKHKAAGAGYEADETTTESVGRGSTMNTSTFRVRSAAQTTSINAGRAASMARRNLMASRGKAGVNARGLTPAQAARAAGPQQSGREIAQAVREQRSRMGHSGQKPSESSGRMRPSKPASNAVIEDKPRMVNNSETGQDQMVTGAKMGRSRKLNSDSASKGRKVTGTEHMGADIFHDFFQADSQVSTRRSGLSESGSTAVMSGNKSGRNNRVTGTEHMGAETNKGKTVTGNKVGRSDRVTGDEIGASRELTGTQYMMPGNGEAPAKVSSSKTLRGGSITGVYIGQSERVTGNEAGSCRNVSGDDYIGQEQYRDFCTSIPKPKDQKVGISSTLRGEPVTGTLTGRSSKVTGDEPGTCKSVTGTPYVGLDQFQGFCNAEQGSSSLARIRPIRSTPGAVLTGLQPGIGGKMTGGNKGECEPLTGTPYVGTDQFADVCPAVAAEPGNADFPQSLGNAPWGQFSVSAQAPMAAAVKSGVTGTRYEQGHITGAFGKADGRVTGTEEFRFGHGNGSEAPAPVSMQEFEQFSTASRITGEGMAAGKKITGDDWERGDRVTGTEGTSAVRRNPTRRGHSTAQMQVPVRTENPVEVPPSKVTGSSGNTEKGALVTYSGGARG